MPRVSCSVSVACQVLLGLALIVMARPLVAGEADDPSATPMLSHGLQGVGELRFGDRLEWKVVVEPPKEVRPGEGVKLGGVSIRSVTGRIRHVLPEPAAYSYAENGTNCSLFRLGTYAIVRCLQDYVFNLRTGAAPVVISPQFNDRSDQAAQWLLELPIPWWRPEGTLPGTNLLLLDYGYTNYGQLIETTAVYRGTALLDLATGRIAIARLGSSADSPVYDASQVPDSEPVPLTPERLVADVTQNGHRVVTVMTVFDRCVGNGCRSDTVPGFRLLRPLSYVFE